MGTCSCSGESIPPRLRGSQLEDPGGRRVRGRGVKMKRKTLILKKTDDRKFLK